MVRLWGCLAIALASAHVVGLILTQRSPPASCVSARLPIPLRWPTKPLICAALGWPPRRLTLPVSGAAAWFVLRG